jgi:hypothetical protein
VNKNFYAVLIAVAFFILLSGCRKHNSTIDDYGKYELRRNFYTDWPYSGRMWADHDDFCLKGTNECVYYGEADIVEMGPIAVVHDPNTLAFFNTEEGFKYSCQYQVYGKQEVYHSKRGNFNLVFIETEQKDDDTNYRGAESYLYQLRFEGRQCITQSLLKESKGIIIRNDSIDEVDVKHIYAWDWCNENCFVSWKSEDSYDIKTVATNCDPSRKIAINWKNREPILYVKGNAGNANAKCDLPAF